MKREKDTGNIAINIIQFVFGLLLLVMVLFSFISCGTTQVLAEKETIEKIVVKDSLIYRDSIVYIPQEKVVEVLPCLDTLRMEIEVAEAQAYLDTANRMLRGELKSKKKEEVRYIERIEYRDRVDTVYVKEPQPYEVIKEVKHIPNIFWYSIAFNMLIIIGLILKIYTKIKGKI